MDIQIVQFFQMMGSGIADVFFGLFYYLLNPLYTMFIPIILFYAVDKKLAYKTGVFYAVTSFFCGTFKKIFSRERPYVAYPDKVQPRIESQASGSSMPSGHAMGAAGLLYPAAKQFGYRGKGEKKRVWVLIVSALVVVLVGFSRVYMAGHYLTDVMVGWGLGLLIAVGLDFAMHKLGDKFYLWGLLLLPVMVLLICLMPEADSCGVGLAFSAAILIGGYLENRFVKLDINVVWWKRLIRVYIAAMGALVFGLLIVSEIAKGILGYAINDPQTSVEARTIGYFAMFFMANAWVFIACPFIFKYVPILWKKVFTKVKQNIVKKSVAKRKENSDFDDVGSESFELNPNDSADKNNSYYFSAHSRDGQSLFMRLGKRGGGAHELWFAYYNKDNAFVNTQMIFSESDCPLKLNCITPLEEWEISYSGALKRAKPNEQGIMCAFGEDVEASFNGKFICEGKLYDFTRDSDELPFARAVAAEKWNKKFFEELNANTQVHTEQEGHLQGVLKIDGQEFIIDSPAMRDHSFGKREWGYMDRHIWLMSMSQELNCNVSLVRYPILSCLGTGYYSNKSIVTNMLKAPDFEDMPSSGNAPQGDFSYSFILKDGKKLDCHCQIETVFQFVMGEGSYVIYESIASFNIDGKQGRGIAEFGYNKDECRWKSR